MEMSFSLYVLAALPPGKDPGAYWTVVWVGLGAAVKLLIIGKSLDSEEN
jgi:hypothetical protein